MSFRRNLVRSLVLLALCTLLFAADQPDKWFEYRSSHFSVVTAAGEKNARDIALRLEQMRGVFASLLARPRLTQPAPVQVVAVASDKDYADVVLYRQGKAIDLPGFVLDRPDRTFVVLNLGQPEPWRAIAHDLAHVWLDANYPPTSRWFDEGVAHYLASLRSTDKTIELGGDPGLIPGASPPSQPLLSVLNASAWIPLHDLLATTDPTTLDPARRNLYLAQSWLLVHFLFSQKKLAETGTYFDLVQNQTIPLEQAVEQAFGMKPAQLEESLRVSFAALKLEASPKSTRGVPGPVANQFPSPIDADTFVVNTHPWLEPEARALLAEVQVRIPEHRAQGELEAKSLAQRFPESAAPHRVLAWLAIDKKNWVTALEELGAALERTRGDPWARYYLAVAKQSMAEGPEATPVSVTNTMQDLRAVLDWYPEFADAYHRLARARMEGGGTNSALEAAQAAIRLGPRHDDYRFTLAEIYIQGKKFEAARALLERLKSSPDPKVSEMAAARLKDMEVVKKYGVPPAHPAAKVRPELEEERRPVEAPLDTRPVQFLKGTVLSVDCSQAPGAVLHFAAGSRTLTLHVANQQSTVVIGQPAFSCNWRGVHASVNYKAGSAAEGDLVSIEVQ
jgi:tetratricopeptide (TPR) repeat protein